MLRIKKISMDYLSEPIGVSGIPRFGWVLESDRHNVCQQAYELHISDCETFSSFIYNSGWVESSASVQVDISAQMQSKLCSCKKYYVRVRVRDAEEISPYSETAYFVTEILQDTQWLAQLITAEGDQDAENAKSTYLCRSIQLKKHFREAYICSSALGLYQLFVNGKRVGRDELTPGWTSYSRHLCYQTFDVTSLLRPGTNLLGALLGAGWYKGKMGFLLRRNNYGRKTALLMQLLVRYEDGSEQRFFTDPEWVGTDGPVLFSEIYDGERYDARLEISAPDMPGSNLSETAQWRNVEILGPAPTQILAAQPACRVRVRERLTSPHLFKTPNNELVLDFGQNLTGWPAFWVEGAAGAVVHLKCFEVLDAAGNVYTENLRTAKQEIVYICKGNGREAYRPHFTYMGFRYVQILSWPGTPAAENFSAEVVYSAMEPTGSFTCSSELVNKLYQNILWSMKGNFLDVPTDCPQRDERMGWTGDAQIFSRTACYLMNTCAFFKKWMKDVAADQTDQGGVPHVVPDIITGKPEVKKRLAALSRHTLGRRLGGCCRHCSMDGLSDVWRQLDSARPV